jgi:undecaprenyl diphosphate synthase
MQKKKTGEACEARVVGTEPVPGAGAIPRHVAIIMDGNGRWAEGRGLSRSEGHRAGAERVEEIVYTCLARGIRYLTIYAFSKENWKRPVYEVNGIMRLAQIFFRRSFNKLKKEGVFFVHVGDREGLPVSVLRIIEDMERNNAKKRDLHLCIAFNYSGRSEIARACRLLGELIQKGEMQPSDIDERMVADTLFTAGIPDPDLLIRTGGELRVSNFLLWQIAYTELWVTDVLWPDFSVDVFDRALSEYGKRERRFGAVKGNG